MYSAGNSDYADIASPQLALSLMNASKTSWQPYASASPVTGYSFPNTSVTPRASIYVLTTQYQPRPTWPELIPLHLVRKNYGATGIDYMLATSKAEVEAANSAGYKLLNIQGYIYKPCSPDCAPPGAEKLWRKFRAPVNDCAVFLESDRPAFEGLGYTAACPAGATTMIGYAYPATDTDNDGLPNGFEYVAGTDWTRPDTDSDGLSDSEELPMIDVPVNDPCSGGVGTTYCYVNDVIFKDGMEAL